MPEDGSCGLAHELLGQVFLGVIQQRGDDVERALGEAIAARAGDAAQQAMAAQDQELAPQAGSLPLALTGIGGQGAEQIA